MKIRTKLTLKNICVTATVLAIIFAIINVVSETTRSRAFFHDLKGEALTKANLFLQNQVDAATMQSIYLNNRQFINEVEVAVYTTDFEMLYHDAAQIDIIKEDRAMIDRILAEREIEFYVDKYQGIGLIYSYGGEDYIVTAAAYDCEIILAFENTDLGRRNKSAIEKSIAPEIEGIMQPFTLEA